MFRLSSPGALARDISKLTALAVSSRKARLQHRHRWPFAIVLWFVVATFASDPVQAQEPDPGAPITATGILEVVIVEDFERPRSSMVYFLREHAGARPLELEFRGRPPEHLETGHRVTVRGHAKGRKLQVDELDLDGTPDSAQVADQALPTTESRRAVVLMVDLQDAQASTRYTLEGIADSMWRSDRSVSGLYQEASLGQFSFEADSNNDGAPDVFGPFTIPESSPGCKFQDWGYAAEQAAESAGIDLSQYQHRIFVLPHWQDLPDCSWAGVANVGCSTYCRAWIAEAQSPMVFAHELGHNLGLGHAGTDLQNDGEIDAAYGDYSDVMGLSRRWHMFNAAHIDKLKWYDAFPDSMVTVSSSGTYQVAPIGMHPDSIAMPQILKIEKADSAEFYYLSYRQPTGYDDGLTSTYTQGINVHRYKGSGYGYTHFITSLNDFESFSDEANGITVTQLGHDSQYATVEVVVAGDAGGCIAQAPVVDLSPADQLVKPADGASYTVSVTNRDNAACAPTSLALSYLGTPDAVLSVDTMILAPGRSASATLRVDTIVTSDGRFGLEIQAADVDGLAPDRVEPGIGTGSVTVDGTPPSVPSGLSGRVDGNGNLQLDWLPASDSMSGIGEYTVHRDGVAVGTATGTSYTDPDVFGGVTYRYSVTATDAVGNMSATSESISVTVGNMGDGDTTMRVTDLDGRAASNRGRWSGEVTVTVRDALARPVSGATVLGGWSAGADGEGSCTTDATGACRVGKAGIGKKVRSIVFTIDQVSHADLRFDGSAGSDPDGDSDGTSIVLYKP